MSSCEGLFFFRMRSASRTGSFHIGPLCPLPGPAGLVALTGGAVVASSWPCRCRFRTGRDSASGVTPPARGLFCLAYTPAQRSRTTTTASSFRARDVTTRGLLPLFSTRNTCHFRVVEPAGCRHAECLPQEHINGFSPGVISQAAMHTMVSVVGGQQRSAARTWGFGDPFGHPLGRVSSHKQAWLLTRPLASLLALALLTKNEQRNEELFLFCTFLF